jgi:hypothetical protein
MEQIGCERDLFQIVFALSHPGCFACSLDCWQKQTNQETNNRDNHEQLNQRKSALEPSIETVGRVTPFLSDYKTLFLAALHGVPPGKLTSERIRGERIL